MEYACFTTQLSLVGLALTKKEYKLSCEGVMYKEKILVQ